MKLTHWHYDPFTSMCATQDFSPFFGFTVAVRTSARLIGGALRAD
jgi:FAD-dependent urate hydroxylase